MDPRTQRQKYCYSDKDEGSQEDFMLGSHQQGEGGCWEGRQGQNNLDDLVLSLTFNANVELDPSSFPFLPSSPSVLSKITRS